MLTFTAPGTALGAGDTEVSNTDALPSQNFIPERKEGDRWASYYFRKFQGLGRNGGRAKGPRQMGQRRWNGDVFREGAWRRLQMRSVVVLKQRPELRGNQEEGGSWPKAQHVQEP